MRYQIKDSVTQEVLGESVSFKTASALWDVILTYNPNAVLTDARYARFGRG